MLDHDPLLGSALEKCETGVVAPVESYRGENVGIERVLERGFLLNWTASNCSTCEKSGGKCGFNFSTYHFKCFCPDRPHARHCNSESVLSAESKYEACKPANCSSGLEISYPFYIRGNGTEFCGHPGFGILCQEGRPIYKTSGASYIIQDITYENHSFRLVNLDVINTTCPIPSLNYSFDRSSVDFIPHHADIYFFYNCTKSFTVNYTMSRVTCGATAINKTYAALVPRDEDLNWDKSVCESVVAAPIQLEPEEANQTIRDVDYKRLLKDGFTLKWIGLGKYCPHCQRSGGRCGFEDDTSVCFCDDGSHPKHCYDENDKLGLKLGLGLILLSYIYRHRFKKRRDSSNLLSMNSSSDPSSKADLEGDGGYFGIPIFSYTELEQATNNFDCEKELGDGGFGTVYYGKLKDGREVAVKRLYEHNYKRVQQFMNEIEILTRLRHKHLLISSMAAVDISRHRHEINLSNLAISKIQKRAFDELIDSCLGYNSDEEVKRMTTSVAELAFQCLQQDKEMRPSMENVLQELKIIQGGESMENPEEVHDDDKRSKNTLPPPSPPCCDEAGLLENIRLPPSPVSVTAKWVSSCSTTPNGSG
ncbi:unnamed protein product [Dovyalis caffra]|uniref:non-specific serine/threonine protein kinase n=1 Tax=Dovyalis caffra TaxID=77055 RepID=A0AAV1R0P6_9ROSI|nr:unnamed protein product [Dovyalis caffra]